jgi:hypothetical protein
MVFTDDSEDIIGAFFYPTVLHVTEFEFAPTSDEEFKPTSRKGRRVVISYEFTDGKKIIVTDDGFIGSFSKNEYEAMNFLNAIFAVSVTFGIGCESLINNDLCYGKINHTANEIFLVRSKGPSERMMFAFLRDSDNDNDFQDWISYDTRKVGRPETLIKIFKRVYSYTQRPDLQKEILWVLNAYSIHCRVL